LRSAFDATYADPDLLMEARKSNLEMPLSPRRRCKG
jgi:hypothetical protein